MIAVWSDRGRKDRASRVDEVFVRGGGAVSRDGTDVAYAGSRFAVTHAVEA